MSIQPGREIFAYFLYVGGQYLYAASPITAGAGDTTAPTVVSASVTDATHIQIVFSESVTATTAGWSFKKERISPGHYLGLGIRNDMDVPCCQYVSRRYYSKVLHNRGNR
jgi:hypothetical protein